MRRRVGWKIVSYVVLPCFLFYNTETWYIDNGFAHFTFIATNTIILNTFVNGFIDIDRLGPLIFCILPRDCYWGCCTKAKKPSKEFKADYIENNRASVYDHICAYTDNISACVAACALGTFVPLLVPISLGAIVFRYYIDRFMVANYWSEPKAKLDGS